MPYNPAQALAIKAEIEINSSWVTITSRVRSIGNVMIKHAQSDGAGAPETSRCKVLIGNDDGWLTEGDPRSPWFPYIGRGTPIRISLTGILVAEVGRFAGEIDQMQAVYPGGSSSAMEIDAIGTWGALLQNDEVLRSSMHRYLSQLMGTLPVATWTLEDGQLARFGSPMYGLSSLQPLVGTHPSGAVISYPQWGSGSLGPWLPHVVSRSGNAGLSILWSYVSMPAFAGQWAFDFVYASGTNAAESAFDVNPGYLGGGLGWPQLTLGPDTETISVAFGGMPETTTVIRGLLFDGSAHHVRWHAIQNGANIDWTVYVDGVARQTDTEPTVTLPAMTCIGLTSAAQGGASVGLGYVSIWTTPGTLADSVSAALGYTGELATDRMTRLAAEEGILLTITGATTTRMGPQYLKTLPDLIADCQQADQGILADDRTQIGLTYRTLSDLYTQMPQLTVKRGSLTPDTRPIWDYQRLVNEMTVSRADGGSATQSDEDHVAKIRRRVKGSASLSLYSDDTLDHQARWRVHVGTASGPRYPNLGINLRNPDGALLAEAIVAMDAGDRLTIADQAFPSQHPIGGADQMVIGWEELLDADEWEFRPVSVPYEPYALVGRWELLSHELRAAISSSATSLDIANTSLVQPMLATTGLGSGYSITVGGEEMQLTAVADSLPTFGNTGTASTGANGSRTPGLPTGSASGNIVVIFASTRNSGTGTVDTPASWTRLPIFPATSNCAVFARIYDGIWSMPTVTYTGGAANEDTIAQSLRLGGKWHDPSKILIGSAHCLNVSAPNVTYPGLPKPLCDNAIVLYFAWKQDDYTSAATPGTEIQEASTAAGNDASQVWAYTIQTTAASVASAVFSITGGASAISRGAIAALRCDYQSATVLRSTNGVSAAHAAGDDVTLTRPMRWGLL